MKTGFHLIVVLSAWTTLLIPNVEARLYRWTDAQGNVHYSDKLPDSQAQGLTELDQRGMVRKTPEKRASAGDLARQQEEQKALLEQKRRDRALLDSFSSPAEIDALRDRQINAVQARQQTILVRAQELQGKQAKLKQQADALRQKKKKIPEALTQDMLAADKDADRLNLESKKMADEIDAIKSRAEHDKNRLLELRGAH